MCTLRRSARLETTPSGVFRLAKGELARSPCEGDLRAIRLMNVVDAGCRDRIAQVSLTMGASDEGEGALQAMVERMRDSKHGESAAIVVCVIAFAIMGCVGGILNASVYSRVAEYYGIAREISTMTSGFLFLILFLIATRKPSLLDRRLLIVVALGCAITAAFVLEFALQMANGPLTVAGFLFYNTASAWASIMMVSAFSSLRSSKAALAGVVCGMALGEVVRVAHPPVSFELGIVEATCSYALIIVMLYHRGGRQLDAIAREASPASLELSNPRIVLAACSRTVFMRRIVQRCDGLRTHAQRSVPCSYQRRCFGGRAGGGGCMDAAVAQREQGGHAVLVRDAAGGGRLHHRAVHIFDGSALGERAFAHRRAQL